MFNTITPKEVSDDLINRLGLKESTVDNLYGGIFVVAYSYRYNSFVAGIVDTYDMEEDETGNISGYEMMLNGDLIATRTFYTLPDGSRVASTESNWFLNQKLFIEPVNVE